MKELNDHYIITFVVLNKWEINKQYNRITKRLGFKLLKYS